MLHPVCRKTMVLFCVLVSVLSANLPFVNADDFRLHRFQRTQLTGTYFSEGANAGDLNKDGKPDIVYGPYWYAGPDFKIRKEIYKPVPQDVNRYADNFFSWAHDFNDDGWPDIFVVGFPGTPAYVYENPGVEGHAKHWPKHQVFDWVSNESPQLIQLVGDPRPELVCTRDGYFGFATVDWDDPFKPWTFHRISEQIAAKRFGHGLGVGDVNGDGRQDILFANGWFEQPEKDAGNRRWELHPVKFSTAYGGAEMYAYDVDGDGDNDVITSEAAHDYGLSWYEQTKPGTFDRHTIMGSHPSENRYGVLFTELHSVALVDMDGDGLKDIVTGKTYWSHHRQSPMWDAGAVVYWFKLVRSKHGVDWIPYRADTESGIGRQISIHDINGDKLPDIVVGGMRGCHVLTHVVQTVDEPTWKAAQPKVYSGPKLPDLKDVVALRGPKSKFAKGAATAPNAIEGELLEPVVTAGTAKPQDMKLFQADRWSGPSQLWWTGARPGDSMTLELPPFTGTVDLEIVLTCAVDYGIVQLLLDDQKLGKPIDLYETQVITTGVLSFPRLSVQGKKHTLKFQVVGANPKAVKGYMVGLDYLRIKKSDGSFVKPTRVAKTQQPMDAGDRPRSAEGKVLNLNFETGDLTDWTAEGNAFEGQPIKGDTVYSRRNDMRSNHEGDYWIGGYELHEDDPQGTLTSAPFVVSKPYGSFLFNGGSHESTRIELFRKDTGKVFFRTSGNNSETMRRIAVDLRAHMGKEIRIRLVDQHSGGWGHLNFDDFRLHAKRPTGITAPSVALKPDEYPHAGLDADEAARAMKLPKGFSVRVGATEPEVKQPIAMAIDDRGRVWIAEAYEYPRRAPGDKGRDRILIFEDTDGNGSLDKRTVFYEGLNLVSGLEVGFGGVWVGAAPYFMFIPDRNGDDVPDGEPEILLDGWGYQDTHETLNAFIWGPDGWLYGCHGVFTHSKVGKPGTPDDERIPLNCAVWRYHPVRHEFDVFAHGTSNPWGVDFNDHGQCFITACVIPHLYHIIQGARYQRQGGQHFNPYTYRDIVTIADHLHYLGATPHSGNSKSDSAGGGHAHSGAMVYLGGHWPKQYRNQLFMNNIHGQRLNMDILRPNGSGYVGSHGPDFLLTGDQASQILNIRYGPDGNAWMIDWYDMQACHRGEVRLHDRTNGRIYKINYGDQSFSRPVVDLKAASDRELVEFVLHKNDWYVRHARRILQERAASRDIDPSALDRLKEIALKHDDDTRRLRAAWALHVIGGLDAGTSQRLLSDASPYVRGWAIQLLMESSNGRPSTGMLQRLIGMASADPSPVVRLYLASAAQKLEPENRWELLHALTQHGADASDHNLPLMYWYAAEPLADVDPARALNLAMAAGDRIPLLREFMLRRVGGSGDEKALAILVNGLAAAKSDKVRLAYLAALKSSLKGRRSAKPPGKWTSISKQLIRSENPDVRLEAISLGVTFGDQAALQVMRTSIADPKEKTTDRLVALESLLNANDPGLVPTLIRLLDDQVELREAALRGLAQYDAAEIGPAILERYAKFTPAQKRLALSTLCARATNGRLLLQAVEAKKIPGSDLTADLVRQLQFHKNKTIDAKLASVWGTARKSKGEKLELIKEYTALVESADHPAPDVELGRAVFAKTCMKCHQLYGVGYKIGPDLTGSNRSNLEYLLSNIVDPSSVMAREYSPILIQTLDGRLVSGLIKEENASSVTVQTADSLVTIPKDEIEQRKLSNKSMMPEDQLKQFSPHEIRSLIAYLRGKQQTPIKATPTNTGDFFNGKDLSGWSGDPELWSVENGELVGRTDGLKKNEWIVSDFSADDFHLTLEVRLVGNQGNSGIQFRSRARDGDVSGYQADIGEGWWGKLYEEHGRGLLWDKSGEEHVKPDGWNRYEVIARGEHIQTLINGKPCVDLKDPKGARQGIFALQLHSGGKTEVRFRKFSLKVLE